MERKKEDDDAYDSTEMDYDMRDELSFVITQPA